MRAASVILTPSQTRSNVGKIFFGLKWLHTDDDAVVDNVVDAVVDSVVDAVVDNVVNAVVDDAVTVDM